MVSGVLKLKYRPAQVDWAGGPVGFDGRADHRPFQCLRDPLLFYGVKISQGVVDGLISAGMINSFLAEKHLKITVFVPFVKLVKHLMNQPPATMGGADANLGDAADLQVALRAADGFAVQAHMADQLAIFADEPALPGWFKIVAMFAKLRRIGKTQHQQLAQFPVQIRSNGRIRDIFNHQIHWRKNIIENPEISAAKAIIFRDILSKRRFHPELARGEI